MILHLDTISVNLLLLHLLLLQDVFRAAYVTAEGFHPRVHKVRQVANISDAVDSMTKNFGDHGIAQYYQFRIFFDIEGGHGGSSRSLYYALQNLNLRKFDITVVCKKNSWVKIKYLKKNIRSPLMILREQNQKIDSYELQIKQNILYSLK